MLSQKLVEQPKGDVCRASALGNDVSDQCNLVPVCKPRVTLRLKWMNEAAGLRLGNTAK